MTRITGTNLNTVASSKITTGQTICAAAGTPVQLSSSIDGLTHGIYITAKDSNTYFIGVSSGVTSSTGFTVKANEPAFLPIKDGSAVYVVTASGVDKAISWIAY